MLKNGTIHYLKTQANEHHRKGEEMKLEELLNKKVLRGNAAIAQSDKQQHRCNGGQACENCSCVHNHPLVNIVRNEGLITRDVLIRAGGEKYLDCKVTNIFAHRSGKLGIEIEIPESEG